MNKEIRDELIRIVKASYKNDYMWYYDGDKFPVFKSIIDLINRLGEKSDKRLPYDLYDIAHDKYLDDGYEYEGDDGE